MCFLHPALGILLYVNCILSHVCDPRHQAEVFEAVKSGKGPVLQEGVMLTGQATVTALVVGWGVCTGKDGKPAACRGPVSEREGGLLDLQNSKVI